jgi:hypothetical protein
MAEVTVTGGERWQKLFKSLIAEASKTSLEIGLLEGRAGSYAEYGGMNTATIGFWHEFGTSRTPARPFLRRALNENGKDWIEAAKAYLKTGQAKMVSNPAELLRLMLTVVGNQAVDDIKQLFDAGAIEPPVSERREKEKAKRKPESVGSPLVFSGNLSQAIAFEVKTT